MFRSLDNDGGFVSKAFNCLLYNNDIKKNIYPRTRLNKIGWQSVQFYSIVEIARNMLHAPKFCQTSVGRNGGYCCSTWALDSIIPEEA